MMEKIILLQQILMLALIISVFADLKMGRRHYDVDATDFKRKKVLQKQDGSTTE